MNQTALDVLAEGLIGTVPTPRKSVIKGVLSGIVMFLIFECVSVFDDNIPRIPAAWLMMVATVAVESVLFFRIARLLHQPRRSDFHFIIRLDYRQRIAIARRAAHKAHRTFITFTGAVLLTAAVLEMTIIRERSVMTLLVIPCVSMLVMVTAALLMKFAIAHRAIRCSHRDTTESGEVKGGNGFFRKRLARISVPIARLVCTVMPRQVRLAVTRNVLYLLRGEIVLTILILAAAPVVLVVLMLMINDPLSPFVTLLPLLAVFMMNQHFAAELAEATEKLVECHWYAMRPVTLFFSSFLTLLLPASVPAIIFLAIAFPTFFSLAGAIRLLNFLIALIAAITVGCRSIMTVHRNDSDPFVALMLFAVIVVGNFIPWAGAVFSAAAVLVMVLLDWEMLRGRGRPDSMTDNNRAVLLKQ
jgi:hypothetical protein